MLARDIRRIGDLARVYWPALAILAAFGVGAVAGDWASDMQLKDKVVRAVAGMRAGNDEGVARQTVSWQPLFSNLHDLETATIKLAPFDTNGRGGAIDEIAGGVIFASPVGQLGYLSPDLEMSRIDLEVPLNAAALAESPISRTPGFLNMMFRVLDLLVVPRSGSEYDIYVSHHRFGDACFDTVVSRATLVLEDGALRPASSDWEEVFVAAPCVAPKTTGMVFEGNESGGRMVLLDARTLLLSLGDLQFNGVDDAQAFAQDPNVDLGKIVAIDLQSHDARIYSSGHRNPQGLLVDRDGTIWETEHGPQGGDEVNVIREGADYGWPSVTYGMLYGYGAARRDWPLNAVQGGHDGFEKPAFAFVPSISISNIVQPDPREFPLWERHLLVGSLYSARALFLARREGDRIVYAEELPLGAVVRDMISMRDGRIAIVTDQGELIFVRNADRDETGDAPEDPIAVTASADVIEHVRAAEGGAGADTLGAETFTFTCSSCHSLAGVLGAGPPLDGVVGRGIGGVEGYSYSAALAGADETWTRARLIDFLIDPSGRYPGTTMPPTNLPRETAQAVADFLATGR